ncbi:MAG TPA: GNAT family N-acetyltransferase [Stellaceae bacterium]|nr:GNAT family N-acetyltransferase [Stellaceae bacterium]
MVIRDAVESDLPFILRVFNAAIAETTANWNLAPVTLEDRASWLKQRQSAGCPVVIAEDRGRPLGFGAWGPYRPWEGYRYTVEHSIYVDAPARGQGVGQALLQHLVERAERAGKHAMVAGIEAGNAVSIRLHERAGFHEAGRLHEVGRKFDRWLDLVFMEKLLRT